MGQAPPNTTSPPGPPKAADVNEAVLASFKGQPAAVMYAGGCSVVCGESVVPTAVSPAGSIDLANATFSAENPPNQLGYDPQFQIGTLKYNTLDLVKYLDTATPGLLKRLAAGPPIPTVVVSFYSPSVPTKGAFLKYTLTNALVVSYKITDAADHTESFSLQFGQAKVEYFPAATSAPTPTPQPFCWDVFMNRAC